MNKYIEYVNGNMIKKAFTNTPQITFEVTDACNLRCEYCVYGKFYSSYDKRVNKSLSIEKAISLIDYLCGLWNSEFNDSFNKEFFISFYGGEPLLNIDFIKAIVDHTKKIEEENYNKGIFLRKMKYSITTNGMLLDKYMDYLIEKEFFITISLDGNEKNNSYRVDHGGKNSFNKIKDNIDDLRLKNPDYFSSHLSFNSVLHSKNSHDEIFDFFQCNYDKTSRISSLSTTNVKKTMIEKFKNIYNDPTNDLNQSKEIELMESKMQFRLPTYQNAGFFLIHNSPYNYADYNELLYGKKKKLIAPTGTCVPFTKRIFVTVNGKILPCEKISQKYYMGKIQGNEIEIDFNKIAANHNKHLNDVNNLCKGCKMKGLCIQCFFNMEKTNDGKDKYKCEDIMNSQRYKNYVNLQGEFLYKHPEVYNLIMKNFIIS